MKIPHTLFLTVSAAAECVCVARNSTRNFNFLVSSVFLASSVTIFTAHCDSWTSRISEDGSVWALRMTQSRGRMWNSEKKHEEKQQQTTVAAAVAGYAKKVDFSLMSHIYFFFFFTTKCEPFGDVLRSSLFFPLCDVTHIHCACCVVNRRQT